MGRKYKERLSCLAVWAVLKLKKIYFKNMKFIWTYIDSHQKLSIANELVVVFQKTAVAIVWLNISEIAVASVIIHNYWNLIITVAVMNWYIF